MMNDLFEHETTGEFERIGAGAMVLRGFALPFVPELLRGVDALAQQVDFRKPITPGGFTMSAASINCGVLGWTSDRHGYKYRSVDPTSGQPWPAMPPSFSALATQAADAAGYPHFEPDACLVNQYVPGARMSLHQDKNERDFDAPIVSVSLGISAMFLFGGLTRTDKTTKIPLFHGDVVVWGGVDRLRFHGVMPIKDHPHSLLGSQRINLTFRRAG